MKKKYIIFFLLIFIILLIFFIQNTYKKSITGNTVNKSDENNILNISSYEATVEVEIHSNKNVNKYLLKQEYLKPNNFKQEVLEPQNIKGLTTTFDGTNLTIENKSLNLKKVYDNYNFMQGNSLSLISFIDDYKQNPNPQIEETENEKIIKIKLNESSNKYEMYKKLIIDKKSKLPTKMEILDMNENTVVYILYKEIKIK